MRSFKSVYLLLTDNCNMHCSFCYRKEKIGIDKTMMSIDLAEDIMRWIDSEDILDFDNKDTAIYFWGGEPFLNVEVIKFMLESYPQVRFCTDTNGLVLSKSKELREFVKKHLYHFGITLSAGFANEKFGSMAGYIEEYKEVLELIKNCRGNSVNLVASNPKTLYQDFKMLYDFGITEIMIDVPINCNLPDGYEEEFIDAMLKITDGYEIMPIGSDKYFAIPMYGIVDENGLKKVKKRYCGSGLVRLLVDYKGNVWQCDGFYIMGKNCLGNIYEGIDWSKLDWIPELKEKIWEFCRGCEIEEYCAKCKCMSINYRGSGDMFKPDERWCRINKMLYKLAVKFCERRGLNAKAEDTRDRLVCYA